MKREIWIEKLRVLATMGVIILHVVRGTYVNEPANIPQYRRLFDLDFLLGTFDWAVPVFLMISGYLLLDSQKDLTNGKLIKYIKKMVCVLFTFGLVYCLIESFANYRNQGAGKIISDAVINLLTGNCWGHMWYVYMLIGIYTITPIIKTFVNKVSDKVLIQILILFWIMTIIVPTIEFCSGIKISNLYTFGTPYVFYYMYGYSVKRIKIQTKWWMVLGIGAYIGILIVAGMDVSYTNTIMNYANVCESLVAMSIFSVSYAYSQKNKEQKGQGRIIYFFSKRSFCIYLVHAFFLNLLNKGLNMYPTDLPIVIGEIVYFAIALVGSLIAYEILSRIPFINKII